MTTMSGYVMAPVQFLPLTFLYTSIGTGLTSTAANTINQVQHYHTMLHLHLFLNFYTFL